MERKTGVKRMPATDLQLYRRDAELLYLRGVQHARVGNRANATIALRQAISLNPLHEHAWLRLSETLDDPHEVACCLQIVLQINPENAQAQRGIAWLRTQMQGDQNLLSSRFLAPPSSHAPDAWWRAWHKAQRAWLWSLRTLLLIPIILLGGTLSLNAMLANQSLPVFDQYGAVLDPAATPITIPLSDPATMLGYFTALGVEREALSLATAAYRDATNSSQTSEQRIDATQQLLAQLQQSHAKLAALPVPTVLAAAHQQYIEGLALEHDALKQILEVNQDYHSQRARQAIEKLQQARSHIALATAQWELYAQNHTTSGMPIEAR